MIRDYSFKEDDSIKEYSYQAEDNDYRKHANLKSSNASIRLEEIRKKYDTPTRR